MNIPFQPPAWVDRLTSLFVASLPPAFSVIDPLVDRHGSWQWTATTDSGEDAKWLLATVTDLSGAHHSDREMPSAVSVTAWQLTPDASRIIESTVIDAHLPNEEGTSLDDDILTTEFASIVRRAASERAVSSLTATPDVGPPEIAGPTTASGIPVSDVLPTLTPLQRRVLAALADPLVKLGADASPASNAEIGESLFLGVGAVKYHLRALSQVLGVNDLRSRRQVLA